HEDNEITVQAEKFIKINDDFILASHYLSFDIIEKCSTTDFSESSQDALIEFDQNVQKECDKNLKNKPKGPKQMEGQINKENEDQQSQMNKELLEKFLTRN
ncbi:15695_t:CDS:1, partial [Racocetra persica]